MSEDTPVESAPHDARPAGPTDTDPLAPIVMPESLDPFPLAPPSPRRRDKTPKKQKEGTRIGTLKRQKKHKSQRRGSTATIETPKSVAGNLMVSESMDSMPTLPTSNSADLYDLSQKRPRRASNLELRAAKEEQEKESQRAVKWQKMFKQWDIFRTKRKEVLKSRVLKGIPEMWRGRAWVALLNPESEDDRITANDTGGAFRRRQVPKYYFDKCVPENDEAIRADVDEIIAKSGIVKHDGTWDRLYGILRAYQNAAAATGGYREGMGYFAAWLIEYCADDYDVFWAFMRIMKGPKIGLEKFYLNDYQKLRELCTVWRRVLAARFPRVERNLTEKKVDDVQYAPTFFLQAFLRLQLPPVLKRRIFDRFCFFGMRSLLGLGLAFVSRNRESLATMDAMDVVSMFKSLDGDEWIAVIHIWNKNWVDKNEYTAALAKCQVDWK